MVVKLNEVVDAADGNEDFGGNANHGKNQEKGNGRDAAVPAVSDAQGQAEVLPLMMHHMHGPQDSPSVMQSMEPVEAKIPKHHGQRKLNGGMQVVH